MLAFKRVYFDTQPLRQARWPFVSTKLSVISKLADWLGVSLFLPQAVEDELEAHWFRDFDEKKKELERKLKAINEDFDGIASPLKISGTSSEVQMRKKYRAIAKKLKPQLKIKSVAFSKHSAKDVFQMALQRVPPFKKDDLGFKDTTIYLSVIEHLKESANDGAVFVSLDKGFQQKELETVAAKAGVRIQVLKNLDELEALMKAELETQMKEQWEQEQHRLRMALVKAMPEIKTFVEKNLEFKSSDLRIFGMIANIEGIDDIAITNVHSPLMLAVRQAGSINVSFDAVVTLNVRCKRFAISPEPKLKIGDPKNVSAGGYGILDYLQANSPQFETVQQKAMIEVEATAEIKDREYSNLKFSAVRKKLPDAFLGISALGLG
jgi:hypothetical protein